MTDSELMRALGGCLYGTRFAVDLASELGVADRTIRRWLSGESSVPEGIWRRLADISAARQERLSGLLAEVAARSKGETLAALAEETLNA